MRRSKSPPTGPHHPHPRPRTTLNGVLASGLRFTDRPSRGSPGELPDWTRGLWVGLALLSFAPPAQAYIDPGTGSALVYVITGLVVSAYFAARSAWYRVAEWTLRRRHGETRCDLAIHCEDPRYEITFFPVLEELAKRGVQSTLFTMYERTEKLGPLPPGVSHRAIAEGMVGYALLNHLEARMLLTTTPQLDVMTFRRSKRVKHYGHLPHALGESRYVRPYAYDFFDAVYCCGPVMETNIRRIEQIRKLPEKQLFRTGIPHYDALLRQREDRRRPGERKLLLLAPSWGPFSLFSRFGTGFVKQLAARHDVLVRPHPQMRFSQVELYQEILGLEGVEVDTSTTPALAMSRADLLVSDISGIMHEFAFIYERPVVIVDHEMGHGGLEGALLGGHSELRELCKDFIVPIPEDRMPFLADEVDAALARVRPERIAEVRAQVVYAFGNAASTTAEQIVEVLRCL